MTAAGGYEWDDDDGSEALVAAFMEAPYELESLFAEVAEGMDNFNENHVDACIERANELLKSNLWAMVDAMVSLVQFHRAEPNTRMWLPDLATPEIPPDRLDTSRWKTLPRKGVRQKSRLLRRRSDDCVAFAGAWATLFEDAMPIFVRTFSEPDVVDGMSNVVNSVVGVTQRIFDVADVWKADVFGADRKTAQMLYGLRPSPTVGRSRSLAIALRTIDENFGPAARRRTTD